LVNLTADAEEGSGVIQGEKRDWKTYLAQHLAFPFEAKVDEASDEEIFGIVDPGPICYGDNLTVIGVECDDDKYGIVVKVKKGRKTYDYPLCDLAVVDEKSPNCKLVDDYRIWDANCRW
jgi:hypothetical protein